MEPTRNRRKDGPDVINVAQDFFIVTPLADSSLTQHSDEIMQIRQTPDQ